MNLRLLLLGVEVLRITTHNDELAEDEYDGSGYTATTPIGYAPSQPTGWHNPIDQQPYEYE